MTDDVGKLTDEDLIKHILIARSQIVAFMKEVKTEWATIHVLGDFVATVVYERALFQEAKERKLAVWDFVLKGGINDEPKSRSI